MDALTFLLRARDVGLRVEAAGGKLMVRGPKRAEAVVRLLAEHKAEVLAALMPRPAGAREAAYWKGRFTAHSSSGFKANVAGRRPDSSPGEIYRMSGTNSMVGAGLIGNVPGATRPSAAVRHCSFLTATAFTLNRSIA